jgi:hypothetical protein
MAHEKLPARFRLGMDSVNPADARTQSVIRDA